MRKYKNLRWFEFLEYTKKELGEKPAPSVYFEILDEIKMRSVESISEGFSFKLKAPTKDLLKQFKTRQENDSSFSSDQEYAEFELIAKTII
jgi:hypothetical protein